MSSQIITQAGSFVTLSLEDGSRISMPSNSKVRITRLRHILLTDSVDYEFSVDNGRVRSKVTPFDRDADRYRVRTPVAVSAVRGTDYRVRVDDTSGTAFAETVDGQVDVAAGQDIGAASAVSVPAGQGAAATASGELLTASLLAEPAMVEPAKTQSDPELRFEFEPGATAQGYRMMISSDAGFVDILDEKNSGEPVMTLPAIPDGRYFGKASVLASDGFEGLPSTFSFKRVLSTINGTAGQGDFGFRFKWAGEGSGTRLYRFQLVAGDKAAVPMVDEAGLTADVLTLSDLPDGDYFWRVGVTQFTGDPEDPEPVEKWTEFEKLTVAG
ncbi:MAG: FecR domain-containing protein [Pseudomonadota bacterium]